MLRARRARSVVVLVALACGLPLTGAHAIRVRAQEDLSGSGKQAYDQIKAFALTGGSAEVSGLTLKRDRVEMTFTGTFYFGGPTAGMVTGAVFVGQGTMRAEAPPSDFERENVKRLLGADLVESDFKTVVLRFSDDTFPLIAAARKEGGAAPAQVQKLATDTDARVLQELGANLPARLAISILNGDKPGVFFAQFDGGRRGRFGYVFDPQGRIPVATFDVNGGEKGIIFQYQASAFFTETWMAFGSLDDYAKNVVVYSDADDVVDVTNYRLNLDVRRVPALAYTARIDLTIKKPNVRAVSFNIGESLGSAYKRRLVNQLRLKRVRMGDKDLSWVQEDWEGGFTAFLPTPASAGDSLSILTDLEGEFFQVVDFIPECFYPYDNVTWLPRHGYLDRATFEMTFRHKKQHKIAAVGTRLSEDPDPEDPGGMITTYRFNHPVPLATFAVAPFERKSKQVTFEAGGPAIKLEFNSVPARVLSKTNMIAVNDDLILGELDNAIRYFAALFGPYPYETFGAAFHPFGFGQGFPTLLMVPPATAGRESSVYSFFAHETSHQWWGNIVAWRSYRDQWLSEGFANYSGLQYAAKRGTDLTKTTMEMLRDLRQSLLDPPATLTGTGKGRLNDIGPMVLGLRLNTSKTLGAYQTLIYNKGALVLRMLQFLMSNPSNGNDVEFLPMMKDFVEQHRNGSASTPEFWQVASQHFAKTPIAQKFELRNLDWFFKQWVYGTGLPTYQLEYETQTRPDGSLFVTGVVKQLGVGPEWQMVLPIVMSFPGNQEARTSVRANGPSAPFEIKVPIKPLKVELDPFQLGPVGEDHVEGQVGDGGTEIKIHTEARSDGGAESSLEVQMRVSRASKRTPR